MNPRNDLLGFIFLSLTHWYNTIDTFTMFLNDGKSIKHFVWPGLLRDSQTPNENRLIAFPKKPCPSQDSNPACSDRVPLLYRLRHHHCLIRGLICCIIISSLGYMA